MQYDFVVVGAGTTGLIVAARLARKYSCSVALIDAKSVRSCLNAANTKLCYMTGHPQDFANWSELAGEQWDADAVKPYFDCIALPHMPAEKLRNLDQDFLRAAVASGYPLLDNFNSCNDGAGVLQFHQYNGQQINVADAYLPQGSATKYLTFLSHVTAERLDLVGKRVTGVMCSSKSGSEKISARKQIILCLGALHTPELLLRSGIGPNLTHKLDGVGKNLQDYIGVRLNLRTTHANNFVVNLLYRLLAKLRPGSGNIVTEVGCFMRSSAAEAKPDLLLTVNSDSNNSKQLNLQLQLLNPQSRGFVEIDPISKQLRVQANYFPAANDQQKILAGLQLVYKIVQQSPLVEHLHSEDLSALQNYKPLELLSMQQYVGTCKMGEGAAAVVDEDLALRGLSGVCIADESVMPSLPSGNTQAPTMMLAEKFIERHLPKVLARRSS